MARGETVAIDSLSTERQFREAVALQQKIWGFDEIELLPVRLFVVATKVGGHVFGAYADGRMVGFCLAIPGLKAGGRGYLHSHMLGVLPEYRDRGIGRSLKLRQREDALARGIDLIEWTFDPLEMRNAYFNIEGLGAVVRRYVRNQYGTTTSHLHAGLPTDRCVAEWWIDTERVRDAVERRGALRPPVVDRISVPADAGRTREFQAHIADAFDAAFSRNLTVVGIEDGAYLLAEFP